VPLPSADRVSIDSTEPLPIVQVDRYKGLLVKQRDIMTGLTGRLNERDEQILRLQEELEAYDSHQKCAPSLMQALSWIQSHYNLPHLRVLGKP